MARVKTLLQLRNLVRSAIDAENDPNLTDSDLNIWINQSATELYGMLANAYGEEYYSGETSITIPAGQDKVTIPTSVLKFTKFEFRPTGQRPIRIKKFMLQERQRYALDTGTYNYRYRIMGNQLYLSRPAQQDLTIWYFYIPAYTDMVSDSSTFDGINGWEEYIVQSVCAKALKRQQDDYAPYAMEAQNIKARINEEMINRVLAEPERAIYDPDYDYDDDGWDWGAY